MITHTDCTSSHPLTPVMHYANDAEHFVAQCKRELAMYPRSPIPERTPHPVVMDEQTPTLLRRQWG